MSDVASLIIRVTTNGVDSATADLGKLGQAAVKAGAAIGGLETARRVFESLVASQRNFDKLNSGLITMTGSAENAAKAFQVLQQFAKETPYGLNQAVEGFTKLVALGLNPSKEALISYGNTAAAMGKDLNQMIEAVADAATGEFERLKEFGIKASQQGDNVSFTFRGVTTTVKKNSEEIQKYLLNIGNTDFAGAMDVRAKTLDGVLSSLADTFDGLVLNIAQSGFGDAVAEQASAAEDAIQALSDSIGSGEIVGTLQDWTTLFNDSFKFISDGLNDLAFDTDEKTGDMSDSLLAIPDAIRDWLPTIQQTARDFVSYFRFIDNQAKAVAASIAAAFTPGEDAADTYQKASAEAERLLNAEYERNQAEADGIRQRSAARKKEIEEQRKQYDERRKQEIDLASLVGNKPGSGGGSSSAAADKAAKAAAKLAEQQKKQAQDFLDTLARQNSDELKAIDAQEQQKLAKLQKFNEMGRIVGQQYEDAKTQIALDADAKRNELLQKQTEEWAKNQNDADSFLEQLRAQNEGELAEIDRQQAKKLKKLEDFNSKVKYSEEELAQAKNDIQEAADKQRLDSYLKTLDDTTSNLKTALGENNALYKAAAITQTIIETYKGAQAAFSALAPIPIVGPALGAAAAAAAVAGGLARVGQIRSAREQGGNLAAGQISTIAERGKPEVIMPAGASRVRTAEQMRQIMGEGGKNNGTPQINIINQTTGRIDSVQQEQDDEGRITLLIREVVSGDLQDSNSRITKSRRATRGQPGFS